MDRFHQLHRLRCISVTQTVFGCIGVLGAIGQILTGTPWTIAFSILQVGFLLGTGVFGIVLVKNALQNLATPGQFLASVICNSILAALSIISCITYLAFLIISAMALGIAGAGASNETDWAYLIAFLVLCILCLGLSVVFAAMAIIAAKVANTNRNILVRSPPGLNMGYKVPA